MSAVFFDPGAYIADMRAIGVELIPFTISANGRRVFSISATPGLPGEVMDVAAKWVRSAAAHPDWMAAVHDALLRERGTI